VGVYLMDDWILLALIGSGLISIQLFCLGILYFQNRILKIKDLEDGD